MSTSNFVLIVLIWATLFLLNIFNPVNGTGFLMTLHTLLLVVIPVGLFIYEGFLNFSLKNKRIQSLLIRSGMDLFFIGTIALVSVDFLVRR